MSPGYYRYRPGPTVCGVIRTGRISQIVRQSLGCATYGPYPTAVTSLVDGQVLVVDSGDDLWIRK